MEKQFLYFILIAAAVLILAYFLIPKNNAPLDTESQTPTAQTTQKIVHLEADEFLARNTDSNVTVIDVRTPDEYNSGHIENAINMDFYAADFDAQLKALDKNERYSVYCKAGSRSGKTLERMQELGFTDVADLVGGYAALNK